jgi:hypothetical protein
MTPAEQSFFKLIADARTSIKLSIAPKMILLNPRSSSNQKPVRMAAKITKPALTKTGITFPNTPGLSAVWQKQ